MGYTTEFFGQFTFDKKLPKSLYNYLKRFSNTRRMKRDNNKIKQNFPNWKDLCFMSKLGANGEYFAPLDDNYGQSREDSIVDYNSPPNSQPSLWCDWEPFAKNKEDDNYNNIEEIEAYLAWNYVEKFYNYIEWLDYEIANFLIPSGISLSGAVLATGEDIQDISLIIIDDNNCYNFIVPDLLEEGREQFCNNIIDKFSKNEIIVKDINSLKQEIINYSFEE